MLRLRTFGGLTLTSDVRALGGATTQRRPLALLAILAATRDQPVTRERLQTLLWPERDESHVRRVLAQTVYALRRDLGEPAVVTGTAELRINAVLLSADVVDFERAAIWKRRPRSTSVPSSTACTLPMHRSSSRGPTASARGSGAPPTA